MKRALAVVALFLAAGAAKPALAYDIELFPGDTVSRAATALGEDMIYAPLRDGSTYYLFEVFSPFGWCPVDTVVLILAETGETLFVESLHGVLYTRDQIGLMADRIGEMADRIVYTEELIVETEYLIVDVIQYTQENVLRFVDLLNPLQIFGT